VLRNLFRKMSRASPAGIQPGLKVVNGQAHTKGGAIAAPKRPLTARLP
jgi:hypothetical protein